MVTTSLCPLRLRHLFKVLERAVHALMLIDRLIDRTEALDQV